MAKNSEGNKQLEVDFVVNQDSQRYYIQVAFDMTSEEKQTQELHSFSPKRGQSGVLEDKSDIHT